MGPPTRASLALFLAQTQQRTTAPILLQHRDFGVQAAHPLQHPPPNQSYLIHRNRLAAVGQPINCEIDWADLLVDRSSGLQLSRS